MGITAALHAAMLHDLMTIAALCEGAALLTSTTATQPPLAPTHSNAIYISAVQYESAFYAKCRNFGSNIAKGSIAGCVFSEDKGPRIASVGYVAE